MTIRTREETLEQLKIALSIGVKTPNNKTKRDLAKTNGIILIEIKYDELFPSLVSDKLIRHFISYIFSNSTLNFCNKYHNIYKNEIPEYV